MKVVVVVLAVLGTSLSANIGTSEIPKFKYPVIGPIGAPQDIKENPSVRIINGQEVKPHSIPYQVYLITSTNKGDWACGGSLITSTTVLTAAHCLKEVTSIKVTLGAHDLRVADSNQISINAVSWKYHEGYNPETVENDVGVIKLPNAILPSETIDYVQLPSVTDVENNFVGYNARVSGWGFTSSSGTTSYVLLEINNTVITNDECKATFSNLKDEEICLSGAEGKVTCEGDSGGPMVIDNIQVGIVSYGVDSCSYGYPTVYARVTSFLKWIEANSDWSPL